MTDRILFIIPAPITYHDFMHPDYNNRIVGKYASVLTDMPLGALSISSYLKKHTSISTKLIDFSIILNEIGEYGSTSFIDLFMHCLSSQDIADYDPTIICISVLFSPAYESMVSLADCCRQLFPNSLILAGGGVPANMYQEVFKSTSSIDAICYGEGEIPMRELVSATDKKGYLANSPSWITKDTTGKKLEYNYIEDLDEIPFYDYELCDTEKYRLNPAIEAYSAVDKCDLNFHIMTSRGCPHHCIFCASHTVHGRRMRYHSVGRVREDLERLVKQYDAKIIVVQDDHFIGTKERAIEIINIFKELGIKAVFQNALALYAINREILVALKEAGVNQLVLAIESGSNHILRDVMHKPLNTKIIKRVVDMCRELDIFTDANIIIGCPGETKKDIEETRNFLISLYINWFRITIATPIVGSDMLKLCLDRGYLVGDYMNCNYRKPIISTEDFTPEELKKIVYTLNLELNFIYNSDYREGRYEMALKGFKNAIRAKSNHAIAWLYSAKCYAALGDAIRAKSCIETATKIKNEDPFWRDYIEKLVPEKDRI